jgi:hypothetical protein
MAVLFDANTEYISIADNAKFNWTPVTQPRTLSFWWKSSSLPNVDGEYQLLFYLNQTGGGNKSYAQVVMSGGVNLLTFVVTDSSFTILGAFYCVLPSHTSDTWHHIVFKASSDNNCEIFWDGVTQSVTHSSWNDTTEINPSQIFISINVAISDNMSIAHLLWMDIAASQSQVDAIYANPYVFDNSSNALLSLHLNEGTGTNCADSQTQNTATAGTLTNGPTWTGGPPTNPISIDLIW